MKSTLCIIVLAVALPLLPVACKSKNASTTPEQELVADSVASNKPSQQQNDSLPEMEVEVRGMTHWLRAGDGIVGHYDKKEKYWVCSDDEPIFETSPNTHGDGKYSLLGIRDKDGTGLVDEKGKIVVLPMYASLELGFTNGFCMVQNHENKYGLIAENGKLVLPIVYDGIWKEDIKDSLIKVAKDGLQGFTDLQGKMVIPFKYESLEQGGEGMIWFMQKPQQWGCINYKNEVLVQAEFTHTAPFVNGKAKAQKADAKTYTIYTNGKVEACK